MRNFLKVKRRTFCIVFGFMILFSLLKFNDDSMIIASTIIIVLPYSFVHF